MLLKTVGVTLFFLPTYSPELNPVEMIWATVKNHLRNKRGKLPFWKEIIKGLQTVTTTMVMNFYFRCIVSSTVPR